MPQPDDIWSDVERIVSQDELRRAFADSERMERSDGHAAREKLLLETAGPYLTILFGAIIGIGAGVMTVMFNFMLFVWILHVSF